MAMLTLSDFLNKEGLLKGLIPLETVCFPRLPDQMRSLMQCMGLERNRIINDAVTRSLEDVARMYAGGVTLRGFIEAQPSWANQIGWSLATNGRIVHTVDPTQNGPLLCVLELDISAWLASLPDDRLLNIAALGHARWRRFGREEEYAEVDSRDAVTAAMLSHLHPDHVGHYAESRERDRGAETALFQAVGRVHPDPAEIPDTPIAVYAVHGVREE